MNHFEMEELIPIVAQLAEKYTSKESTSITYDTAKQLMGAVIYCINETKQEDNKEVSMGSGEEYAKLAYEEGVKIILEKVQNSKKLFEEIVRNFKSYENLCYYDTIIKGMPAFFQNYDVRFNPQNHLLTLDYPTMGGIGHLCGVDAIHRYLCNIRLEQSFLEIFPENYIVELLEHYHDHHEELLINICQIIMRNTIGHMLINKPVAVKGFENNEYEAVRKKALRGTVEQLEQELSKSIRSMISRMPEENQELSGYLIRDVRDFSIELMNAAVNNCLQTIFII